MKTIIIGIAGGTGSGKSTFTKKLKKEFKDDVAVLYHDNYYRDQSDIPLEERRKTNYDHPDAMETELLIRQLMNLKAGKAVDCPVYDYTQHTRSDQVVRVEPKKVILLEGILVLADERLRDLLTSRFMWRQMRMNESCVGSSAMSRRGDVIWKVLWSSI